MPLLDMKVSVDCVGKLVYPVHTKPSYTDRYISFCSDHPLQHKRAVVNTLFINTKLLSFDENSWEE